MVFFTWNTRYIPPNFRIDNWFTLLKNKKIIATFHHIDEEKYKKNEYEKIFNFFHKFNTTYHSIFLKY